MKADIAVVGGGIIGLCCAYYLQKEGRKVMIIDRTTLDHGASYVNAGYISPSHLVPLSSPGMPRKAVKYMFDPDSPFYLKPKPEASLLRWCWQFYRHSTKKHVDRCAPFLKRFNETSQSLYEQIADEEKLNCGYSKRGILKLCRTKERFVQEKISADFARNQGLEVKMITPEELKEYEPLFTPVVAGAVIYMDDALLTPQDFMRQMKALLIRKGVRIMDNLPVEGFKFSNGLPYAAQNNGEDIAFSEIVIAGGAWSPELMKYLGKRLLLQAGKGYCIEMDNPGVRYPAILSESNVAVSPMGEKLRLGGTMELAGNNERITRRRVRAIRDAVARYYPNLSLNDDILSTARIGLRPVSPDGMPYIGPLADMPNVYLATGHGMMGMSQGPATGKLISDMILQRPSSIDVSLFNPGRFS